MNIKKGVTTGTSCTYSVSSNLVFLHEVDVGCALDFYGLTVLVVQSKYEVEKVGFSEITGRLFLVVCAPQSNATNRKEKINTVKKC